MLKRKLVRATLLNIGLFILLSVKGTNSQPSVDPVVPSPINSYIRQLQAFDSSFAALNEMPEMILGDVPAIPLNRNMSKFVKDYTKSNSRHLDKIKLDGQKHLDMMDSIFAIHNLPPELKYLAIVESQLKSKAVSPVGAVGPWQFMPSTAKLLSLKITRKYDERTHYAKSTVAAARYLRQLHDRFGDWLLVIAAYNSGPGKVLYAIKMSGSRNFWALQGFLPPETRGHVKRFIATHYFYEGRGGITTVTKAEAAKYKKLVSEFISDQKLELQKELADTMVVKINIEKVEQEKDMKQIKGYDLKLNNEQL
jgi:membrane-bound lytic murein transglycosylase D